MTQSITYSQLEQLRRDAKRLRRENGLGHAQALDQLAAQHGFQNWSLLARHAQPDPDPSSVHSSAEPTAPSPDNLPLVRPRMEATRAEHALILAIAKRYEALVSEDSQPPNRLHLLMDIEACHCNGCPLDLVALLEAKRDIDVIHDVSGIRGHINRDTGQLEGYFRPRYALPSPP